MHCEDKVFVAATEGGEGGLGPEGGGAAELGGVGLHDHLACTEGGTV